VQLGAPHLFGNTEEWFRTDVRAKSAKLYPIISVKYTDVVV
jgi:hypothetical protein